MEQDTEKLRDLKDLKYKGYLLSKITKEWCEEEETLMYFFHITRLSDGQWTNYHINGSNINDLKVFITEVIKGELEPFYYIDDKSDKDYEWKIN